MVFAKERQQGVRSFQPETCTALATAILLRDVYVSHGELVSDASETACSKAVGAVSSTADEAQRARRLRHGARSYVLLHEPHGGFICAQPDLRCLCHSYTSLCKSVLPVPALHATVLDRRPRWTIIQAMPHRNVRLMPVR